MQLLQMTKCWRVKSYASFFEKNRTSTSSASAPLPRIFIQLVGTTKPELLFLDICMPDMDGFDVIGALSACQPT